MKKGAVVFVSLALLLAFCVPVAAQPSAKAVETIVIDSFDTPDNVDWTWKVQSSHFVAEGYPKIGYFKAIPNPLRPFHKEGDPDSQVLGVKVKYQRKGDNWVELYPESKTQKDKNGEAYCEIPFTGVVSQVDFWVWGADYLYYLDMLVRDADGRVHTLPAGNLAFHGWRNVIVEIPGYIRQQSRFRSGPKALTFVGFRIRTDPNEYVDDFIVYFDQLRYTTNTLADIYDGYDLKDQAFEGEDTNKNSGTATTTTAEGGK